MSKTGELYMDELEKAYKLIEDLSDALRPFANSMRRDDTGCTINTSNLGVHEYQNAQDMLQKVAS